MLSENGRFYAPRSALLPIGKVKANKSRGYIASSDDICKIIILRTNHKPHKRKERFTYKLQLGFDFEYAAMRAIPINPDMLKNITKKGF